MNPFDQHFQFGLAALNARNLAEAERRFRETLKLAPKHPGALNLLAVVLMSTGRFAEAEPLMAEAVKLDKNSDAAFANYGIALMRTGKAKQAVEAFSTALRLNPKPAMSWNSRGAAYNDLRQYQRALPDFAEALQRDPNYAEAYVNKGLAYAALGQPSEAFAAFDKATSLAPNASVAWLGRGDALYELKRTEEALASQDKALALTPELAGAWLGRGNALHDLKRYDEAFAAFDKALALVPELGAAWLGKANALFDVRRFDEAMTAYDEAAKREPAEATFNKALASLSLGQFTEGWEQYEMRAQARENIAVYPALLALGLKTGLTRDALRGKTVLVLAEQGVGDEIMFAGMLPDLIADAKAVTCEVDARLLGVMRHSFPGVTFVPRKDRDRLKTDGFDVVLQAGSLGRAYRREASAFPQRAYLKADEARVTTWQDKLAKDAGGKLKVGISWRGGTAKTRSRDRSVPLERLRGIVAQPGCHVVSLQYGDVAEELRAFNASGAAVHTAMTDFNDFDEFAALIAALDLVISVQNTTIHMAGALGKPCWGLLPWRAEWRYGAQGEAMPWYPSARLFRQTALDSWDDVLAAAGCELTAFKK